MGKKVCKGVNSGTVYIEDEEAAIHRYLSKQCPTYSELKGEKPMLNIPLFGEPLVIGKVRDSNEMDD